MTVDFRCENCGKLLSVDAQPGEKTKCPHCQKSIVVPEGLASLPRPQVPPDVSGAQSSDAEQPPEEELLESGTRSRPAVSMLMSAVISLFFHVGIALVCLFFTFIVVVAKDQLKLVLPDAAMTDDPGGTLTQREVTMDRSKRSETKTRRRSTVENPIPVDAGKTSKRLVIGVGGVAGSGGIGFVSGGGGGARSSFFGSGGTAHHIVYVIDRSGSMTATFDVVSKEMINSIGSLRSIQDFHVIFFNVGPPLENPPKRLVPASRENRGEVAQFLERVIPQGKTDPVPALMRAFDVLGRANSKPGKLIYLLTDGDFPNNKQVLTALARKNVKKDVHINTYLYEYEGKHAMEVMKKIATENGGRYKHISVD